MRTEIAQQIFYLRRNDDDLLRWIENEIGDDTYWADLKKLCKDSDDPATQYIVKGDAEGLLLEAKQMLKKNRLRGFVKRILMKVF